MRIPVFLTLFALLAAANGPAHADRITYHNDRFDFSIGIPFDEFTALPPPETGDGREFEGLNGRARLGVFGAYNENQATPEEFADFFLQNGVYGPPTYKRSGRNWVVLSGYMDDGGPADDRVYYMKAMFNADRTALSGFEIQYYASERHRFDPIVEFLEDTLTRPK